MPRAKRTSAESAEPRRRSTRIADRHSESPTKAEQNETPSPKKPRRASTKKVPTAPVEPTEEAMAVDDEVSPPEDVKPEDPKVVTTKTEVAKQSEEKIPVVNAVSPHVPNEKTVHDSSDAGDFEVVDKDSLPAPNAPEVEEAIKAQGEDGGLLVNYVQVSKSEVPPVDSKDVIQAAEKAVPPPATTTPVAKTAAVTTPAAQAATTTPSAPAATTTPSVAQVATTTPSTQAATTTPSAQADTKTPSVAQVATTTPSAQADTKTPSVAQAATTTPSAQADTKTPSAPATLPTLAAVASPQAEKTVNGDERRSDDQAKTSHATNTTQNNVNGSFSMPPTACPTSEPLSTQS